MRVEEEEEEERREEEEEVFDESDLSDYDGLVNATTNSRLSKMASSQIGPRGFRGSIKTQRARVEPTINTEVPEARSSEEELDDELNKADMKAVTGASTRTSRLSIQH
eukprot:TRINITY_DN543_c0_g1_i8.p2 TRINITY_DN543_c0_g1~~TRINITY_DN543_c0_g1_i8.p2  ORF type:complete len:108 (-),score=31.61 TRINITY_DN543_c0_g1_i8:162-485(-)